MRTDVISVAVPLTPGQCRAARALLDWTQDELARRAEVSRGTIQGFEGGQHALHRSSAAAMRRALEVGGALLLDADADGGPGVRLAPGVGGHGAPPGQAPQPLP
ncbi:helix-turn-helix transcriptional regulator [Roseomonas sp. CCTCC AB2023176]|uniref:helix-turn-helix transcriptional regulator n=1 Tax=Roseomonas sp. CCTCC AB2023176 TaxID=3342640 RepID=UPI0035DA9796